MVKNKIINTLIAILLVITIFNTISAEVNTSDQRYLKILGEFDQNKTYVPVIIEVFSENMREGIISSLREDEFRFLRRGLYPTIFSGEITRGGLEKLTNNSNVRWVNLEEILSTTLDESVPLINATNVWIKGYSGKDQTICVIDSGINASHPYLKGRVIAEKCYCSLPEGNNSSCCPDGTSIDDNAEDNNGHGTHVAGIVASNDSTYRGVVPNASIVAVKVCNSSVNNNCNSNDIISGITWCTNNANSYNISVITISIGSGIYTPNNCIPTWADSVINDAYEKNISVTIASGNDGSIIGISYPACSPNATSVGASNKIDDMAPLTNRASNLDLLAPGTSIRSAQWNSNGNHPYCVEIGTYMICSGTSQAAPHVAGAAALLKERDPTLTPENITKILKDTGKNIYDNGGSNLNFKRIDITSAIDSLCTCSNWTIGPCNSTGCSTGEKLYTRTCNPSNCSIETNCVYDSICNPYSSGTGVDITVCKNGSCNYTSIGNALKNSGISDKIFIKDNGTYEEELNMNSSTSGWIDCEGAKISKSAWKGVFINDVDGPVIANCYISGFDYGIYLNSSYGLITNNTLVNNQIGIYTWKQVVDNKIKNNNITGSSIYGIRLYADTWSESAVTNKIQNNFLYNNDPEAVSIKLGDRNNVQDNIILGSSSYGINLDGSSNNLDSSVQGNTIYNNNEGIYFNHADYSSINNNIFCLSNTNVDINIDSSTGTTGDNNRCEKPGTWDDMGTTGCTYYCDNPATVTLLYPLNNFVDYDGNVELVCQAEDDYQLVNVTLYHNINGTWQANQTRNITGISNITTFNINNILDETSLIWNCLAYDNKSRGGFANSNWSINISILPNDTSKFYHKDSSGDPVAWLGNQGNIVLKGKCYYGGNCDTPGDNSIIFRNSSNNNVAFINSTGDLCIEIGDCSDHSANCNNPGDGSFIVQNSTSNTIYISAQGDLCLVGGLYENANP